MLGAIDTETTGLDLRHIARPFLVTTCLEDGTQKTWGWDIDPFTRKLVRVTDEYDLEEDVKQIAAWLEARLDAGIVFHNGKFDLKALMRVGVFERVSLAKVLAAMHDTMASAHLLGSNDPKNLTDQCMLHLREDISKSEKTLDQAAKDARKLVSSATFIAEHGEWMIAKSGMKGLPSLSVGSKSKYLYKNDLWLPRTVAQHLGYSSKHPWWNVLQSYADDDPAYTLALHGVHQEKLESLGLVKHYEHQMKLLRVVFRMECGGVTYSDKRITRLYKDQKSRSVIEAKNCVSLARRHGFDLVLPKGASPNNSIREFCYDVLKLPVIVSEKTGNPTLNKEAMEEYRLTLDGDQLEFVQSLSKKRSKDTALAYLDSYRNFSLPVKDGDTHVLYPSINPFNTNTLRYTSENPNEQQVKKRLEEDPDAETKGLSPRYAFGPRPGRVWYKYDYRNVELRIPFYKSKQKELIELFERPNDPPYYGSVHLANFHAVYEDVWNEAAKKVGKDKAGLWCKKEYEGTIYQWVKNGGFSRQYGGQRKKVDATFRRAGAFDILNAKFDKLAELNAWCLEFANAHGYIETLPDLSLGMERGYPLVCKLTEYGGVKPTIPLSYMVQGTAMWGTSKAMVRCQDQLDEWNRKEPGADYRMVLQVHDELDFEFPDRGEANLPKVKRLQYLMELSGKDIGIPLKVAVSYHPNNWGQEVEIPGIAH